MQVISYKKINNLNDFFRCVIIIKKEDTMKLNIEYMKIKDINEYENNARKHTEGDVHAIAKSIEAFGFSDPIGIWGKTNTIVEGHGRYLAALELGMDEVPVIRLDHLSDEERRAYALAHNKTAELSGWDFEKMEDELTNIDNIDMSDFGFLEDDDSNLLDGFADGKDVMGYSIMYEIAFNNEEEQEDWYRFLKQIKNCYERDTISERILDAVEEWRRWKKL